VDGIGPGDSNSSLGVAFSRSEPVIHKRGSVVSLSSIFIKSQSLRGFSL
jgi:hypothetical protein